MKNAVIVVWGAGTRLKTTNAITTTLEIRGGKKEKIGQDRTGHDSVQYCEIDSHVILSCLTS